MALTLEEMEINLQGQIDNLRKDYKLSHDELAARFDRMDLNGAAAGLRDFGYWLKDNPEVFARMRKFEDAREERMIAFNYLRRISHIDHIFNKVKWVIVGLAGGLFIGLGGPLSDKLFWLLKFMNHSLGH